MDFIIKQTAILGLFVGSFLFMIFGLNLETNLKNVDLYEGKLITKTKNFEYRAAEYSLNF